MDDPAQIEDPDRLDPLVEPVGVAPPTNPPTKPRGKIPTAVTVVMAIGAIAALIFLVRGGLAAWVLWQCDALARLADGMPAALTQRMVCGPEATVIDPLELLTNAVVGIGFAVFMAIILASFARLRSWAWTALMMWCGFVLARDLFQYFVFPEERPNLYLSLFFSALIVLALNQEDVQMAFGIKREAHDILSATSDLPAGNSLPTPGIPPTTGIEQPGRTV
jgi:hypothetical protein